MHMVPQHKYIFLWATVIFDARYLYIINIISSYIDVRQLVGFDSVRERGKIILVELQEKQ